MKKILMVVSFVFIFLTIGSSVNALEFNLPEETASIETVSAVLVGDKDSIDIDLNLIETRRYYSPANMLNAFSNRTEYSVEDTYEAIISANAFNSSSDMKNKWDSTNSVKVYLTIYYNEMTVTNGGSIYRQDYLLTRVSGNWSIYLNGLEVVGSHLAYGCTSPEATHQRADHYNIHNNNQNSFTFYTGFDTYVFSAVPNNFGAHLILDFEAQGVNWDLELNNTRF